MPKDISHTLVYYDQIVCFGFFAYLDFWFSLVKSCANSRTDRSMNDYIEIVIDAIDQWIKNNQNCMSITPRLQPPPLRAEWWVKQICKFAHIFKHYSYVFLFLCFFFFNLLFQWLAVFLKVNLIKNQIVHRMHHQRQRVLIRQETRRGPQKSFERVIEFCGKFGNCNLIFVSESPRLSYSQADWEKFGLHLKYYWIYLEFKAGFFSFLLGNLSFASHIINSIWRCRNLTQFTTRKMC